MLYFWEKKKINSLFADDITIIVAQITNNIKGGNDPYYKDSITLFIKSINQVNNMLPILNKMIL